MKKLTFFFKLIFQKLQILKVKEIYLHKQKLKDLTGLWLDFKTDLTAGQQQNKKQILINIC